MRDFQSHPSLLPAGFSDLMPGAAQKEADAIQTLMQCFTAFGYQRVKPPLMEFEESLLAPGPGAALASDTFRVMDPVSHKMMGLRADITAQIARIVQTRFAELGVIPLRLTYANDALRTRAGQLRTARQFCQVGCELIDESRTDGIVELCVIAAQGLQKLGLDDITIDFTWPRFTDDVLALSPMVTEAQDELREALRKRDRKAIEASSFPHADVLVSLLEASGDMVHAHDVLSTLDLPESARACFDELRTIVKTLPAALADMGVENVRLSFDPFETSGFEYHHGTAFTIFSPARKGELGRGGAYKLDQRAGEIVARGFTLYMDTILSGLPAMRREKNIAVPADLGWDKIRHLQKEGWLVSRVSDMQNVPEFCTHVYQQDKIIER